jgi:S-adenosylmethionine synthetase
LCDKCEIQLSYAIGIAQSVSIFLEDFNTAKIEKNKIVDFIVNNFDLSPK